MNNYLPLFPLILTGIRLIGAIFILPPCIYFSSTASNQFFGIMSALLFMFFALTDFFDGYYARKFQQETIIGAILDPLADKCLVITTLIVLVAAQRLFFVWALILIIRELLLMSVRTVLIPYGIAFKASKKGKWKACLQYIWLTMVITFVHPNRCWDMIEKILLVIVIVLSWFSAIEYLIFWMRQVIKKIPD